MYSTEKEHSLPHASKCDRLLDCWYAGNPLACHNFYFPKNRIHKEKRIKRGAEKIFSEKIKDIEGRYSFFTCSHFRKLKKRNDVDFSKCTFIQLFVEIDFNLLKTFLFSFFSAAFLRLCACGLCRGGCWRGGED